jgi:hypothetical protein
VKDDAELREDVKVLKRQFDTLVLNKPVDATDPMHFTQNCPTLSLERLIEEVNALITHKWTRVVESPKFVLEAKFRHLIREVIPLKLRISISHHTKLNHLLIKHHNLHLSLHWKK